MIPVQGYAGQTVAILGMGRTGRAAAASLVAGGAKVVVSGDGPGRKMADRRVGAECWSSRPAEYLRKNRCFTCY